MKKLIVRAIQKKSSLIISSDEKLKSKKQILLDQGKAYYNFVFPVEIFTAWCNLSELRPNDRLLQFIKNDIEAHNE